MSTPALLSSVSHSRRVALADPVGTLQRARCHPWPSLRVSVALTQFYPVALGLAPLGRKPCPVLSKTPDAWPSGATSAPSCGTRQVSSPQLL